MKKNRLGYTDNYNVPMRANTTQSKYAVMNRLAQLWVKNPDLRLGQLIGNLGGDAYYIEDFDLINELEIHYAKKGSKILTPDTPSETTDSEDEPTGNDEGYGEGTTPAGGIPAPGSKLTGVDEHGRAYPA